MHRVDRLLRSVDRVQQRSRWLGFPCAVTRKLGDDNGGALTTVVAYNAFFALFPLLLVVVTVLGFLLGRDSGFQQRRGLPQVAQHAMAELWNIPGKQRPSFWARQVRRLLLVVFAVGLAATILPTWLGGGLGLVSAALPRSCCSSSCPVAPTPLQASGLALRQPVPVTAVADCAWQAEELAVRSGV
jgi:uncharacterized BrkB/YihY/UPF0761 family membrane protein